MDEMTQAMLAQIKEIEEKDENQILAELAGATISEYIYETIVDEYVADPATGKKHKQKVRKVKLSWVGTRETARNRGNLVLSEPLITETDEEFRIIFKATDLTHNFVVFGGTHQPKKMKVNDYDKDTGEFKGSHLEEDPYAFQKGLSKAQRNAFTNVIPADYSAKMIDRFLTAGRKAPQITQGSKQPPQNQNQQKRRETKPKADWDRITPQMVPDYATLETLIWNLAKLQPADMYKKLGGGSRSQMTITAWQAFLQLKTEEFKEEP
jgi:hypothetical protein